MCGISGTIGFDINPLVNHQVKRGPDDSGLMQIDNDVTLGHNRLSIIDLTEAGHQPMTGRRYSLTYNGEIYNYRELGFYGNDARVLLNYIETFGIHQAIKDVNGMYAFCCFDAEKRKLYLVVDRMGQKPLYYCHFGAKFAFASTVGALMQLRDKWEINRDALQSYWLLGSVMGENSMIEGIKKLTGSHILTYDLQENSVSIERYWTPQFQENTSGIEDLILDAIDKVKVSDVPIYVFLSGGIDSTLVASRFPRGQAVHLNSPELEYAQEVRRKFDLNLAVVDPTQIDVMGSLRDYAFQVGEPSMAALIPYVTSKEVSKFAKVAISANGADELFFGYDRTSEVLTEKQLNHIFRDIPKTFKDWVYPFYGQLWGETKGRWWELQSYVQFDLNKTLDAASMCHSLEVRSPFLDHRLVEMALSIPEGRHFDMRLGRKAILKRMLEKMGFNKEFLTRPKLGFSLHKEPEGMEALKNQAWNFVKENGFLKCDDSKLSGRDERYLKMSALSFWTWYQTWENKL